MYRLSCTMRVLAIFAALLCFVQSADANTARDLSAHETRLLCLELGMTPDVAAAVGMSSTQLGAAMERVQSQGQLADQLSSLIDQARTLRTECEQAWSDARTVQQASDATAARSLAQQLESQIQAAVQEIQSRRILLRGHFFQTTGVSAQLIQQLCDPVPEATGLPVEYRAIDLDSVEAAELASAAAIKRRSDASGESIPSSISSLLNQYDAKPEVISARSNLQIWLAVNEQYFWTWN